MSETPIRISRRWFLANVAGALLCAAGMRLLQEAALRWLAAAALIIGIPLMTVSLVQLLRQVRRGRPGAPRR